MALGVWSTTESGLRCLRVHSEDASRPLAATGYNLCVEDLPSIVLPCRVSNIQFFKPEQPALCPGRKSLQSQLMKNIGNDTKRLAVAADMKREALEGVLQTDTNFNAEVWALQSAPMSDL